MSLCEATMPRPIYILCCESMNIDTLTGLPSYINVYDTVTVNILPVATSQPFPLRLRASALWVLAQGEGFGLEYEHQFLFRDPASSDVLTNQSPTAGQSVPVRFVFDRQFYRADAIIQGQPFSGPGIYRIESRLRQVGADQWITQYFPLRVEVIHHNLGPTPNLPSPPAA